MENLKVGMSFEVVELLRDGMYIGLFKKGGFTIDLTGNFDILANGQKPNSIHRTTLSQHCACMFPSEVKPIGRLTITSLK